MECEEGQPTEDVDSGTPAALSFWQRIGPRVVALIALVGPAAAVFLTQHWHSRRELIQDLKETQPTTGYAIETTKAAPEVIPPTPEVRLRSFTVEITQFFFTRTAGRIAGPRSSCKPVRFVRSSTRFSMAKLRSRVAQMARKFFAALFRSGSRR